MFPRSRATEQDDGTEEDRMVSRLQLDLGTAYNFITFSMK